MKVIKNRRSRKVTVAAILITTTMAGIVTYRTRQPLPEKKAVAFAKMVSSNGKFLDATVVRSRKAGYAHVCYIPSSDSRIANMERIEDAKDVAAANRDGSRFVYSEIRPDVFLCEGITGTYEVSCSGCGSCSCPQFKYRRSSSGGRCKHIVELSRRAEAGMLSA